MCKYFTTVTLRDKQMRPFLGKKLYLDVALYLEEVYVLCTTYYVRLLQNLYSDDDHILDDGLWLSGLVSKL